MKLMDEMKKELLDVKQDEPDVFPDNRCGRLISACFLCSDQSCTYQCPFTCRKMFYAGPNFLSQPKNLTAFTGCLNAKPDVLNTY